jgi:hypothetical protein
MNQARLIPARLRLSQHAIERYALRQKEFKGETVGDATSRERLGSLLERAVRVKHRDPFRERLDQTRHGADRLYFWSHGWLLVVANQVVVTVYRAALRALCPIARPRVDTDLFRASRRERVRKSASCQNPTTQTSC